MSTRLLDQVFGTRGSQYTRTDYPGGRTIFTIRQGPKTCRCPSCGSRRVVSRGRVERRFGSLPIGSRATAVVLPTPRVECRSCGAVCSAPLKLDHRVVVARGTTDHSDPGVLIHCCSNSLGVKEPKDE